MELNLGDLKRVSDEKTTGDPNTTGDTVINVENVGNNNYIPETDESSGKDGSLSDADGDGSDDDESEVAKVPRFQLGNDLFGDNSSIVSANTSHSGKASSGKIGIAKTNRYANENCQFFYTYFSERTDEHSYIRTNIAKSGPPRRISSSSDDGSESFDLSNKKSATKRSQMSSSVISNELRQLQIPDLSRPTSAAVSSVTKSKTTEERTKSVSLSQSTNNDPTGAGRASRESTISKGRGRAVHSIQHSLSSSSRAIRQQHQHHLQLGKKIERVSGGKLIENTQHRFVAIICSITYILFIL